MKMFKTNSILNFEPLTQRARVNENKRLIIPSRVIGIGGYPKAILPRLDSFFHLYLGERPTPVDFVIFDFDEANGEVNVNGRKFTTQPYLVSLPKKPLKDIARKLRRKDRDKIIPWINVLSGYVDLRHVRYVEAPGLNLLMQTANLAWRLVWPEHIVPQLKVRLQSLHPSPQELSGLESKGYTISNRSLIFVLAGGGSTTGPSGLIPILVELNRLKPVESNVFIILFTPNSYRDKTSEHKKRGRAIFRATIQRLIDLFNGMEFNQPYGINGYRLRLEGEPFDHLFLVDGSLGGGREELDTEQVGELVARLLFKLITSPLGEKVLGHIGNLNRGLKEVKL